MSVMLILSDHFNNGHRSVSRCSSKEFFQYLNLLKKVGGSSPVSVESNSIQMHSNASQNTVCDATQSGLVIAVRLRKCSVKCFILSKVEMMLFK